MEENNPPLIGVCHQGHQCRHNYMVCQQKRAAVNFKSFLIWENDIAILERNLLACTECPLEDSVAA